jgi:hypothetical protein
MQPSAEEQVHFLLNIGRLLQDGGFVATYKHALLLSIADICVENGDDTGAKFRINIDELADKYILYYWRQAIPYQPLGTAEGAILKQNTGKQALVITLIEKAGRESGNSITRLKVDAPRYRILRKKVARTIRKMPLWKLQTIGRKNLEFLYPHAHQQSQSIELKEGVCFCFRLFHGLIHELVRGAWLRFVRSIKENQSLLGTASDISDFMFGSSRAQLEVCRPILADYQNGQCFYCVKALQDRIEVDHFIPWSRYPVDFGHNFVLSHQTCNAQKGDRLAAEVHLERWWRRSVEHGAELTDRFQEKNIVHDLEASRRITLWAYEQAEHAHSDVWSQARTLVELSPAWRSLLEYGRDLN